LRDANFLTNMLGDVRATTMPSFFFMNGCGKLGSVPTSHIPRCEGLSLLSTDAFPPEVGTRIGSYELLELVGKGGMGTVFRARGRGGAITAVKILASHLTQNDVLRTRFYLEAKLAMSLDHPNIVRAIYVGEDQGRHYLVMEFIDGESVSKRLQRDGVIPEKEAIPIIVAVARALEKAHREGLVHRDVKPDNILLTRDGQTKLTDLGLAKKAEIDLDLTRTGKGLGTPHFMAPEQFRNAKSVDARSDLYSLAATLYVMISGKLPFRGDGPLDTFMKKSKNLFTPIDQICPQVASRTLRVIHTSMCADPDKRPSSAKAVADYLEATIDRLPLGPDQAPEVVEPIWFVKADDPLGGKIRIRGPESTICAYIEKGKIGIDARASLQKKGPYEPLADIDTFRNALRHASAQSSANRSAVRRQAADEAPRPRDVAPAWAERAFWTTLILGIIALVVVGWVLIVR
jgi:serine/threonine protein kinase